VAKCSELGVAESSRSQLSEKLDSLRTELQKSVVKSSNSDVKVKDMSEQIELLRCEVCSFSDLIVVFISIFSTIMLIISIVFVITFITVTLSSS